MGRLSSTEQKLDMALDELVDRKSAEDQRTSKGYGPAGRQSSRDGPYSASGEKGRGDGNGKGKGKRKLPIEEKALLHTQCFFNSAGELVVKLYDTQVFVLKKRSEEQKEKPKEEKEVTGSTGQSKEKSQSTSVLILTSGGFRTAETRSILNEALQPMALRINGSDTQKWTLCSDYKTPGQVTTESSSQQFEDGMEVSVLRVVTPQAVKDHMAARIQAGKEAARGEAHSQPSPGYPPPGHLPPPGWGAPPHPHPHGWGMPPPGWGPPPPGWRPLHHPPPPHAWAGHPPPAWGHPPPGAHPNGKGAPGKGHPGKGDPGKGPPGGGARPPPGPVSDDMFQ